MASSSLLLVTGGDGVAAAMAWQEPEPDGDNEAVDSADTEYIVETIEITGTRLGLIDDSLNTEVYTLEDIRASGATTAEQFLRTLTQTQFTIGSGLNSRGAEGLQSEVSFDDGRLGGLGVAAANLRGLGSANTLVLVNGRRVAGAAGIENGMVNLNTIPLSAVERVEITYGGASAVYGSDAVGGVINFILKRNYEGFNITARAENSNNGGNSRDISLTGARTWRTGSATATLSYRHSDPVQNRKAGYTTHDYRGYYTPEQLAALGRSNYQLDMRSHTEGGQPGILSVPIQVVEPDGFIFYDFYEAQLRAGVDPLGANANDLDPLDPESLRDFVPLDDGESNDNWGFSLNLQQSLTERLRVSVDVLASRTQSSLRDVYQELFLVGIPYDQAYNPLEESDVAVEPDPEALRLGAYYFPAREYADGRLSPGYASSTIDSYTITTGLEYDFSEDSRLRVNYTYSGGKVFGETYGLDNLTLITQDPDTLEWTCGLDADRLQGQRLDIKDLNAIVDRQCEALTSSDPALAFNFLSDGEDTRGAPVSVFNVRQYMIDNASSSSFGDAFFSSTLASLPAGDVIFGLGGEYRQEEIEGELVARDTQSDASTEIFASFAELRVPLVGGETGLPLIAGLELSLQARYDRYRSTGPIGIRDQQALIDRGLLDESGVVLGTIPAEFIETGEAVFDRVSPRVGIVWRPFEDLLLRGSWTTSFTPPSFTSLYSVNANVNFETALNRDDPLAPDPFEARFRPVTAVLASNPELKPETAETYSFGLVWAPIGGLLQGLSVTANYDHTMIENRIGDTSELGDLLDPAVYFGLDEIFTRGPDGYINRRVDRSINIGALTSSSLSISAFYDMIFDDVTITPSLQFTDNLKMEARYAATSDVTDLMSTATGVDDYRVTGAVRLTMGSLTAMLTGRYTPAYVNNLDVFYIEGQARDMDFDGLPDRGFPVDDYTTFDFFVSYYFDSGVTASIGGRNITDAAPPFTLVGRRPYDASRYDTRGRIFYADLRYDF